jgi:hypothetical protein
LGVRTGGRGRAEARVGFERGGSEELGAEEGLEGLVGLFCRKRGVETGEKEGKGRNAPV